MVSRKVKSLRQEMIRQDKIVRADLFKAADEAGFAMAALLTAAVQSWKLKPKFTPETTVKPELIQSVVKITGKKKAKQVFGWVDQGTGKFGPKKSPYIILPKKPGGSLFFNTGYQPRTKPIAKANVGPGKASGPLVVAKGVIHPGIKAREFTTTLEDNLSPDWKRRAENALKRASRRIKS